MHANFIRVVSALTRISAVAERHQGNKGASAGSRNGHASGVCSPDKMRLTLRKHSRAGSRHYSDAQPQDVFVFKETAQAVAT